MPMHLSMPTSNIQILNLEPTQYSPLISKCQIKVLYVSDEPNRNGSVITKAVAEQMAPSLRGAPIVGYFSDETNDFEGHNRDIQFTDEGGIKFLDTTKAYGFVDLNAKIWFQTFCDDDGIEREYLVTEGYLWTEQYEEAKRILSNGNNQSMELDENTLKGEWTKNINNDLSFFIINEALISKLCILGENVEPCFEGAQITKVQFSLEENFQNKLFSLMRELNKTIEEGGKFSMSDLNKEEILETNFEDNSDLTEKDDSETISEEEVATDSDIIEVEISEQEEEVQDSAEEEVTEKVFSVEETQEYQDLLNKYNALEEDYNTKISELTAQVEELTSFKLSVEKTEKEKMINDTFYMLSDEDKADVVSHINEYSLDDIEAKLSVICVRNKVNFNLNEESSEEKIFDVNSLDINSSMPAWIEAALETQKNLK